MDVIEEGILSSGGSLPNFISHLSVQRSLKPQRHQHCLSAPVLGFVLSGLGRLSLLGPGVVSVALRGGLGHLGLHGLEARCLLVECGPLTFMGL